MAKLPRSDADLPSWETEQGRKFFHTFQSWKSMRRLIEGTLRLEPKEHAHEVRAAASMVIMFCREGMWPTDDGSFEKVLELAARQLSQVKQLYETKGRIRPQLQSSRSFRQLLKSLDEEIRILEARLTDPKPKMPNVPPCTWGDFWAN